MKRGNNGRRWMASALLLALCLGAAWAQAGALPPGAVMLEVPDTGGALYASQALALEGGDVLIGGKVEYPGEYRVPYRADYESDRYKVRNDAIAMRLGPEGEVRWTIRFGDPQADNFLTPLGLLPDGRALMAYWAVDSTFEDKFFIVDLTRGRVEEMLPWREIADHYSPRSLMYLPAWGYLGGDSTVVDDAYDHYIGRFENPYMEYSRVMTLLDLDLDVVWRTDLSHLGRGIGNYMAWEVAGGIVLTGQESVDAPDVADGACTSLLKLDGETGEILWQLTDAPRTGGMQGAGILLEAPDGALLFTGAYLPEGETLAEEERLTTLTKLTPEGEPIWTRRYEHMDIRSLYRLVPFGEGYLMLGSLWSGLDSFLLIYVDGEGEVLGTLAIDRESELATSWMELTEGPDGTAYVTGPVYTAYHEETDTGGDLTGSFLCQLTPEQFVPAE